jgi:hypothetical protein
MEMEILRVFQCMRKMEKSVRINGTTTVTLVAVADRYSQEMGLGKHSRRTRMERRQQMYAALSQRMASEWEA